MMGLQQAYKDLRKHWDDGEPMSQEDFNRGPKLLAAEIAHVGDPAFDVGTLLAHVLLADCARPGAHAGRIITGIWSAYSASHPDGAPTFADVARYAGIEMLRRTIGAARVAVVADESAALRAIALGRSLTTRPPDGPGTLAAAR